MEKIEEDFLENLGLSLQSIVPQRLSSSACEIPKVVDFEFEEEADLLRNAGTYRKREFTAGRSCARAALRESGIRAGSILYAEGGLPAWPEGAIAVISHSRGYCVAAAGLRRHFRALGLDLEMTNRLTPAAIDRVVHPIEQEFVQSDQHLASLVFCAKEAFYKAQYPIWETQANFKDVAFAVDFDDGTAQISFISKQFPEELRQIAPMMQFSFEYVGNYVVALCWLQEAL